MSGTILKVTITAIYVQQDPARGRGIAAKRIDKGLILKAFEEKVTQVCSVFSAFSSQLWRSWRS
jgi:hypothetical protein